MNKILLLIVLSTFTAENSAADTILVVGDSLSAAYNMPVEKGWVYLLNEKLDKEFPGKHKVVNASISGDTSAGGLARLPAALAAHKPDILVIELGANDGLRALPLTRMRRNLSRMIELAEQQQALVILAGMQLPPNYGPFYTRQFHQIYVKLSKEYEVVLIPFLLDRVGGKPAFIQPDGLHPNAAAQPLILDTVWENLKEVLK